MKNINIVIIKDKLLGKNKVVDQFKSMNHFNYSIIETPTLNELNNYSRENNIDVILLSKGSSDADGIDLYKKLEEEFPDIGKIVFVDGKSDPIMKLVSENSSNDYLVNNSFSRDDLFKSIFKIVGWKEKLNELKESKEFFESAFDSLRESIVILDEEGRIIYLNKAGKEFAKENFKNINNYGLRKSYLEIFKNESKDLDVVNEISAALGDLLKNKIESFYKEFNHQIAEKRYWYSMKMTAFSDKGKKRIIIKYENITSKKEREFSQETSIKIFENSMDLLAVGGFDGYLKVINPAWTKLLGWSKEELLSKPSIEFVHPDDRTNTLKARIDIGYGLECNQFENRYLTKNGNYKWLSWNSYPYREKKNCI